MIAFRKTDKPLARLILSTSLLMMFAARFAAAQEAVPVGADFGLTGSVARYGEWARRGVELALNDSNRTAAKHLNVIFEDNLGETTKAVSAYYKLRDQDKVQAVLTYLSNIALAVSPLANRDRIVQMDVSANAPSYSSPDDYTFRTGVVATELVAALAALLNDKLHVPEAGILFIENAQGYEMTAAFTNAFRGTIKASVPFQPQGADYKAELLRLRSSNVHDVFLVAHLEEAGVIVRQARQLGLPFRFFSTVYSIEGPEFLAGAAGAADGVLYVAPRFSADRDGAPKQFADVYRSRFNEEATYFAAQAYDGVVALHRAAAACPSPVRADCLKQQLYTLDFEGASGRVKFDRNGDVHKEIVLKTVVNGKFQLAD